MSLQPATKEAYDLLIQGSLAMARMSEVGIRIDVSYLDKSIEETKTKIVEMEKEMQSSKEYNLWAKHYGNKMKLSARHQLGRIIFDVLGYKRNPFLELKNNSSAFEHLIKKVPFLKNYFESERLKKALSTNLLGIRKEVVDGFVHPNSNISSAESYRSNSSEPNFKNQPIRNKVISKIVRSCVIPREGHVLLEPDYETQEVRVSYCYNRDPKLLEDILTGDMHTDRAKELFMLSEEELGPVDKDPGKTVRYAAKNKFVFAQFYGSYYGLCAPDLWESIAILDLKRSDGLSLYEHLRRKGITKLGKCDPELEPKEDSFEFHVREVERRMWNDVYTTYAKWKRDWWDLYQEQGGVNTLTGFVLKGWFRRNQILCDPIQGSAFHCLLWSMIQIQKEFRKKKMKSLVVNEVYDSILIDAHKRELDDCVEIVKRIAIKETAKHFPWIICPLSVGFDIGYKNWFEKTPLEIAG